MTEFDEFALELIGEVEVGQDGLFTGMTKALCLMVNDVILSDDPAVSGASWEDQKAMIRKRFYKTFPYMKQ